ncbi:MAG TPA: nuclear transport factor 2 family protein [Bryobacteraceae bacterium]|nr:nuclear transport factor 2 family protein [Bryobacteraceae bacterium]
MSPSLKLEIEATNAIFEREVAAERNVEALDRVYTQHARILPPGAPMMEGRENIKAFWRGAIESLDVKFVKLETVDFEMLGDTGVEVGRATLTFRAAGAPPAVMKYVVIWKREEGAWKWHIDIWNPNA